MTLFIHNGKIAKERDPLVVRFEDNSERNYTVAELDAANSGVADLGEAVTIAGKDGVVVQDPTAKYYKDVTLSVPASVVDGGTISAPTAVITTASGTDSVPAVITLGGTYIEGYGTFCDYTTDVGGGNAGAKADFTMTAAQMAILVASNFNLRSTLTAVAVGATIEILASGTATTVDLANITVAPPTP